MMGKLPGSLFFCRARLNFEERARLARSKKSLTKGLFEILFTVVSRVNATLEADMSVSWSVS